MFIHYIIPLPRGDQTQDMALDVCYKKGAHTMEMRIECSQILNHTGFMTQIQSVDGVEIMITYTVHELSTDWMKKYLVSGPTS